MTDGSPSPYTGRWVARMCGKIIAQGDTPDQALYAAKQAGKNRSVIFTQE